MTTPFSSNPGVASAALRGLTIRVQSRPGAPTMDDPLATTTVVDSLDEEMAGFAEADAMAMIGEDEELVGMSNEDSVNNTAFLENNYPLAISKGTPGADAGFGAPLNGDMIAAMMGGGAPGGMPGMPPAGPVDPRKRGAMRGLGLR